MHDPWCKRLIALAAFWVAFAVVLQVVVALSLR